MVAKIPVKDVRLPLAQKKDQKSRTKAAGDFRELHRVEQ